MQKFLLTLLCIAISAPSMAFDFKEVAIGQPSSPADIKEKLGVNCGTGKNPMMHVCNGYTTIAGIRAYMNLVIGESGNVQRISLLLKSKDYYSVALAMTQKYGEPNEVETSVLQNAMGATFNQSISRWLDQGNTLTLKKYSTSVTDSSIYFSSQEDVDFYNKLRQERADDI